MANNFKDSYYALKTVEIGVNIATIAKKYRFFGGWRSKMEIDDLWSKKLKNLLGRLEFGGWFQIFSSIALKLSLELLTNDFGAFCSIKVRVTPPFAFFAAGDGINGSQRHRIPF